MATSGLGTDLVHRMEPIDGVSVLLALGLIAVGVLLFKAYLCLRDGCGDSWERPRKKIELTEKDRKEEARLAREREKEARTKTVEVSRLSSI